MKRGLTVIILWTAFLLVLMLAPIVETPMPTLLRFKYFDKVAHFGLFTISGLVYILGAGFLARFKTRVVFAIIFGLALAIGTEFMQSLVPLRDTSLYDLLADVLGLATAIVLSVLLHRQRLFIHLFGI